LQAVAPDEVRVCWNASGETLDIGRERESAFDAAPDERSPVRGESGRLSGPFGIVNRPEVDDGRASQCNTPVR
jgi:hypothetical protein